MKENNGIKLPRVSKLIHSQPKKITARAANGIKLPRMSKLIHSQPDNITAIAANTITKQKIFEEYGLEAGFSMEYRDLIKTKQADKWKISCGNELGRIAQGMQNRVEGTNTIFFVDKSKIPKNKIVTYPRIVCDIRPSKPDPYRTKITAGVNLIDYPGRTYTPTAGLVTVKTFSNSITREHTA